MAEAAAGARTEAAPLVSGVVPEYNSAPLIGETTLPGKQPLVFILVLNWNGLADTTECLRSLSLLGYKNKRVVVVDNGSDGEEAIKIETTFPAVTVIRNKENFGYAGGNNVGIRYALTNGADYVWLLNNDTMVPADCLNELVAAGEKHSSVGLLSPLIYSYAPPHAIEFAGSVLRQRSEEQWTLTLGKAGEAGSESGPVMLWGTALLLKRHVADVVGLLDERYFAYHEDLDYCLRAVAAGFETLVVPEASLYHKRGRSLGSERSPIKEYLLVRNWYLLWTTHLSGWRRWTYPCRYLAWVLNRMVNARQAKKDAAVDYALDGAWDALRGHWGSWETKGHMPRSLRAFLLNGLLAWHPYFTIMVIAGNLAGVWSQVVRRLLRNRASIRMLRSINHGARVSWPLALFRKSAPVSVVEAGTPFLAALFVSDPERLTVLDSRARPRDHRDAYDALPPGAYVAMALRINGPSRLARLRILLVLRFRAAALRRALAETGAVDIRHFGLYPELEEPTLAYELGSAAERHAERGLLPRSRSWPLAIIRGSLRRWSGCHPSLAALFIVGRKP